MNNTEPFKGNTATANVKPTKPKSGAENAKAMREKLRGAESVVRKAQPR